MATALLLLASLAVILWGANLFTGAVEYAGHRFGLTQGAVGSVLAAVGTAMPEAILPLVALVGGAGEGHAEIGIGAILGAPLMLSTVAMSVVGLAMLLFALAGQRTTAVRLDADLFQRDMTTFLVAYSLTILAALVAARGTKVAIALGLVAIYVWYVRVTLRAGERMGGRSEGAPARRSFGRLAVQVLLALAVIVAGARLFVGAAQVAAGALGISPFLFSVVVAPIATELPEKFNSVLWVGKGQDALALGNITGALVFQSTLIPAAGIMLTPWTLHTGQMVTAALALLAAGFLLLTWRVRGRLTPAALLATALFYLVFCSYVLAGRTVGGY